MLNRKGMLMGAALAVGAFFAAEQAQAQNVTTRNWRGHAPTYSQPVISGSQFAASVFRSPAIAQAAWGGWANRQPSCSTPVFAPRPTCSPPRVIAAPRQVVFRRPIVHRPIVHRRPIAHAPRRWNDGGIRININW